MKIFLVFIMYFFSINVFATEFEEILKKAEQGDRDAQYNVSQLYHDGLNKLDGPEGTKRQKHIKVWKKCLFKAANQGQAQAQSYVGIMYYNAYGLE